MGFKGSDYDDERDGARLSTQHIKVREAALAWPGGWFTMAHLSNVVMEPPGSVERQVRYLRDLEHGDYDVDKRHCSGGTWEYRVRPKFRLEG